MKKIAVCFFIYLTCLLILLSFWNRKSSSDFHSLMTVRRNLVKAECANRKLIKGKNSYYHISNVNIGWCAVSKADATHWAKRFLEVNVPSELGECTQTMEENELYHQAIPPRCNNPIFRNNNPKKT